MPIQVGTPVPDITLKAMTENGIKDVKTSEILNGKKVVLFAVPGAFTPTCNDTHLPGFLVNADKIKAAGADTIACVAVNDPFVMGAWAKANNVGDDILMLADGNGELARAMDLSLDITRFGMGYRSRRYAAIIDDGVIQTLNVEPAGEVGVSSAETILEALT